jgi:hypothetical protein
VRTRRAWRAGFAGLAVAAVLALAAAGAYRTAERALAARIASGLGPGASVGAVRLAGRAVEIDALRIAAPPGWPAADALCVDQVRLVPSLRSLLGGVLRLAHVTLVRPALVVRRTAGGTDIVPALAGTPSPPGRGRRPAVVVDRVTIEDGRVDLYDAAVARPAVHLRLDGIAASVDDVAVAGPPGRSRIVLAAVVRGVRRDGVLRARGWIDAARGDADSTIELRGVDLVALGPYLAHATDVHVTAGTADLTLAASVRRRQLRAPGHLALAGLVLARAHGVADGVLGLPRAAVLALLRDGAGTIPVDFTLEGDVASPRVRLDEPVTARVASAVGARVGVDPAGVAAGVGGMATRGLAAVTALARRAAEATRDARPAPRR